MWLILCISKLLQLCSDTPNNRLLHMQDRITVLSYHAWIPHHPETAWEVFATLVCCHYDDFFVCFFTTVAMQAIGTSEFNNFGVSLNAFGNIVYQHYCFYEYVYFIKIESEQQEVLAVAEVCIPSTCEHTDISSFMSYPDTSQGRYFHFHCWQLAASHSSFYPWRGSNSNGVPCINTEKGYENIHCCVGYIWPFSAKWETSGVDVHLGEA